MISASPLTTALSDEHAADLRRAAMQARTVRSKRLAPRLRLIAVAAVAAGIALFASAPAWAVSAATTVYASPTGSTIGSCIDPAQPCQLQYAIDQAIVGGEVVLQPGTYLSTQSAIGVYKQLDVHGQDGQPAPTIVNNHSTCATNDGFCLGQSTIRLGGPSGSLRHVRVLATGGEGPTTIEAFNTPDSQQETIEDVYAESLDGIAIATQGDVVIRDSVAWAPSSPWAVIDAAAPPSSAGMVNVRLENVTAVGGPNAYGLWVYAACLVNGCGVAVHSENTILRGGKADIWPEAQYSGEFLVLNSHSNYDIGTDIWGDGADPRNQTAEPQFVDAANGDFHQLESSPTRDAGIASADLGPVDLDGGNRTFGSAPDIGADEWTPAPPAPQQPQGGDLPTGPSGAHPAGFSGVRLTGGRLHLRHGKLRVRVSCPQQAASYCKGLLSLSAAAHGSAAGRAQFTLKPGQSKQVSVSLTSKLRKLRRFNATVTATARDAHGQSFSTRAKVRVHRG
jgi:hypothetical protein